MESAKNRTGGQVAYSGGPCLYLSKTCEMLSWGPQDLETVWLAIWVELVGKRVWPVPGWVLGSQAQEPSPA